jgi:putative transposase
MARPVRIQFEGAVYHIMARGNERRLIFLDAPDRQRFLRNVAQVVKRYAVVIHAYCLMNNHYHIVMETPQANLALAVRQLNGVYSQSFNRRHHRVGHLFQGRYRSQLVGTDRYFLTACRYVVLNPVRAGLCARPEDWEWSSFRSTVGLSPSPRWLGVEAFLGRVGAKDSEHARSEFSRFVLDGAEGEGGDDPVGTLPVFASDRFISDLSPQLASARRELEFPRRQRFLDRPSLGSLFDGVETKSERDARIHQAHIEYGYTMKAISEFLGIHYVTVSRAVRKMS